MTANNEDDPSRPPARPSEAPPKDALIPAPHPSMRPHRRRQHQQHCTAEPLGAPGPSPALPELPSSDTPRPRIQAPLPRREGPYGWRDTSALARDGSAGTRRAPADVPRTSPFPSAGPSRGHIQGALLASRRLHRSALHLLPILLPRLTRSALARRSLKAHQRDLLARLTVSLRDLKETQKVAYADLPQPDPWEEVAPWGACKSLGDVAVAVAANAVGGNAHVPHITLLRCALANLAVQNKPSTADDIFQMLFATDLPSLLNIDDAYQESLWKTLNDAPLFRSTETSSSSCASAVVLSRPGSCDTADASSPAHALQAASVVTQAVSSRPAHRFQHTLQALIDFTGYLTTKTYALASAMHRLPGTAPPSATAIEEEEIRMEIKALKGLVLNRRTFIPRPSSAPVDNAS
ncbi:hypothetical protein BC826DRAFT_201574 [Russula brevipes]|nr:hypothetical protein BC826DRAFT_201574 [Russula brevipes]